jgi:ferredoxin
MDNIDFSEIPPVFHKHCENCAICWAICPKDAVEILNMIALHLRQDWVSRLRKRSGMGGPPGGAPMPGGAEGGAPAPMPMGAPSSPKFRPKISSEELYSGGLIMLIPKVPRIVLNKEDWPYEMDEG